ncbi:MAG: acid-responsive two-component system response regulator TcrA [Desulfuromonadia bacterium]
MHQEPDFPTILLVEDDHAHAALVRKNLQRGGVANPLLHAENGRVALDLLLGEGGLCAGDTPPPLIILLDLNMPEVDGYQVLRTIRADHRSRHVPVVVLTTTDTPQEIQRCYELGCNVYITKPVEYDRFCDAMRSLGFFLGVVKIPERGGE